jgi:hypothetical protein
LPQKALPKNFSVTFTSPRAGYFEKPTTPLQWAFWFSDFFCHDTHQVSRGKMEKKIKKKILPGICFG